MFVDWRDETDDFGRGWHLMLPPLAKGGSVLPGSALFRTVDRAVQQI
ncbi:hypothetical protein B4113_3464 [Geobacillus sp. B4113_201601]|nr:hypothetical protein B4113_3464 [Geobacillus sp. B4113_201601]